MPVTSPTSEFGNRYKPGVGKTPVGPVGTSKTKVPQRVCSRAARPFYYALVALPRSSPYSRGLNCILTLCDQKGDGKQCATSGEGTLLDTVKARTNIRFYGSGTSKLEVVLCQDEINVVFAAPSL